jgi:hypothetical protein
MFALGLGPLWQCLEFVLAPIHGRGLWQQSLKRSFAVRPVISRCHVACSPPVVRPSHGAMLSPRHASSSTQGSNASSFAVVALFSCACKVDASGVFSGGRCSVHDQWRIPAATQTSPPRSRPSGSPGASLGADGTPPTSPSSSMTGSCGFKFSTLGSSAYRS